MKKLLLLSLVSLACLTSLKASAQDLFTAARTNSVAMAESLIASGADINQQDNKGYTPLTLATYDGSYDVAALLLQHHADTEKRDRSGRTALMGASFKGDEKEVRLLLDHGADVDAKDSKGMTSLMYALLFTRFAVVKELREQHMQTTASSARN